VSGLLRRLVRLAASRMLSFVLLGAWAGLLAMWVIPFQISGLAEGQVSSIASSWWPLRLVYVALAVATLACVFARASVDVRRALAEVRMVRDPSTLLPTVSSPTLDLDAAHVRLTSSGWGTKREGDVLAAWRWRASLLGGSAFHLGIVVFVLAVALAPLLSDSTDFRLIETEQVGASLDGTIDPLRQIVADATLEDVVPRYFGDVLLFERLDATWKRADGRSETFSLASPLWVDPITTVSIQDFGLAPRLVVRSGAEVVQDTTAAMSIFPPGAEDAMTLTNADLVVTVAAFTDYGVVDGRDVSMSYNIGSPRLRVAVSQGTDPGRVVARGLLAPGESLTIPRSSGAPYELVFEELLQYGTFRVARSFAVPLLVLGGLLMIAGMGMRVFRPRTEMVIWAHDGVVSVTCRTDRVGLSPEGIVRRALGVGEDGDRWQSRRP